MRRPGTVCIISYSSVPWRAERAGTGATTEGWQDKRAHIAPWSNGSVCLAFGATAHIVAARRNLRQWPKPLCLGTPGHIAGQRHGR